MNIEEFRNYCMNLKGVTECTPFDEEHLVFKVLDKMFALTNMHTFEYVNLKCEPEYAIELREKHDFILPGYHMSKKHWNTIQNPAFVNESFLVSLINHSYEQVKIKMTKGQKLLLETME
jgi:predicted DNA-binding protein (MmcQ/YjbR family)